MALEFILGNSGVGKTHHIYNQLIEQSIKDTNTPLILIVPEQFTLQTQQEIIQLHPRKGIMNIEVLSFGRLAYRICNDLSMANMALLKETGKSMVIRKLVEDAKDRYPIFSSNIRKKGYVKELKGLITEFYQYDWQPEGFKQARDQIKNPLLIEKMKDAQMLFEAYKDYLKDNYITTENTLDLLVPAIAKNDFLKSAEVYIDGFYGFTPVQYRVIGELIKYSKDVHIAVTIDQEEDISDIEDESQLFYESKKIINNLREYTVNEKIELIIFSMENIPYRYKNNSGLFHLERNIFRYPYKTNEDMPNGLFMSYATNMRVETRYVVDAIMKLIMEKEFRYKDIAVVTGDLMSYEAILKQAFEQYKIPYFMDKKKNIISHPLVELLLTAIEVIYKDFSYDSIFRYIKTGLLDIDESIVDQMENYVLAYGIKGHKAWEKEWVKPYPYIEKDSGYVSSIIEDINNCRLKIIAPLMQLKDSISIKERNVLTVTKGLYQWLNALELENKINFQASEFEQKGQLIYQKEYNQIYKMVIEILDQIVDILGEQKITIKKYALLLQAGFEECEMGLVPPGLDQVVIGDLERTRLKETKALFVVGLNEGKIPKTMERTNILSDVERVQLKSMGLLLAPDNKENIYKEQFSIYMALTRVSEKLYLSYAKSDLQGKSMRPSLLFHTIHKMFRSLKVIEVDHLYQDRCIINKSKPTFSSMINKLNAMGVESIENNKDIKTLYQWYYNHTDWKDIITNFEKALYINNDENNLCHEAVEALYGKVLKNSVSRLETFARCPFAHFMDYGLQLRERLDYSIKMPDIGILFHKAIDICSKKIDQRGLSWHHLKEPIRNELVEEAVSEVIEEEKRGLFTSSSRNIYLTKRLTRITKRALWAISKQISKGDFKPVEYELGFDGNRDGLNALSIDFNDKYAMKLSGRVDRVDAFEDDNAMYLTVVDYKSGNQSFDMLALYYGLQLQLFIYLNSVSEMKEKANNYSTNKKVIPAGVFYFHIDDPIIKDVSDRNIQLIEEKILKELKLKGLVLDNKDIIKKLDGSFEKSSDIIPVALTVNGELSKQSSVASLEQFELLKQYTTYQAKNIGTSIIEGQLKPYPYKRKKETGCDYCKYLSICRFEKDTQGSKYRNLKELSKDEIWERMMV